MAVNTQLITGAGLIPYLKDLARLRIQVFRDFPYLYDGTEAYEATYLQTYIQADQAMAVVAFDGASIIGASTGVPMANETAAFQQPFIAADIDPDSLF